MYGECESDVKYARTKLGEVKMADSDATMHAKVSRCWE